MKRPIGFFPSFLFAGFCAGVFAVTTTPAAADPIRHPTAIFAGLDKTTGRIINFDVSIDETVQFGSLQITPRVCNTRPQTETPQTTTFVEVDELIAKPGSRRESKPDPAKSEAKRIFSGWMFAASPGLHGVEHPVYDVWLVDCKGGKEAPPQAVSAPTAAIPAAVETAPTGKKKRSRTVEPTAPAPIESQPIGPAESPDAAAVAPVPDAGAPAAEPVPAPKKKKRKPKSAAPPAAAPASPGLFPF